MYGGLLTQVVLGVILVPVVLLVFSLFLSDNALISASRGRSHFLWTREQVDALFANPEMPKAVSNIINVSFASGIFSVFIPDLSVAAKVDYLMIGLLLAPAACFLGFFCRWPDGRLFTAENPVYLRLFSASMQILRLFEVLGRFRMALGTVLRGVKLW